MHAPVLKRAPLNQYVWPAIVLALVASIALGVVAFDRSGGGEATLSGSTADAALLAKEQRYYAAKEARLDAQEAAAGAQVARSIALTSSQQVYSGLKADQMNGITLASTTTLSPALQGYYDRKSDEMNGIVTRSSTTLTPSLQIYSDLKADQLNGSMSQPSTTVSASQQLYVDLKSDQMDGIASTGHAASWQLYVDLKSDQMDGITAGQ